MIPFRHLRRTLPMLLCLVCVAPAAALDTIYLTRHAEKVDGWPTDHDIDAFQPLSPAGVARAEALAKRLKDAGVAAAYTSRTTRTLSTALPLVAASHIPLHADDATTKNDEMMPFLEHLMRDHANNRAVLIVGHSNTVPQLLVRLGAKPDCYARLGLTDTPGGPNIEGYEGFWKVDLKKQGCEAITRE
jgi:broad specificity phosphatase PhoE